MDFHKSSGCLGTLAWHGMGSGKTLSALWSFRDLKNTLKAIGVPAPKSLIFVPKSAVFTWRAEIKKNTPDLINDCIILPYSQMHHAHNRLKYADIRNIIFDESHYLKSPHKQTNRVKSLANFFEALHNSNTGFAFGRIFSLTGTPTPNGAFEMYNQWAMNTAKNCLEVAERLRDEKAYGDWKATFSKKKLNTWQTRRGQKRGNEYQGVDNVDMYSEILKSFVHYRAIDDCLDLPAAEDIMVDLDIADDKLLADVNIDEPESFMALQEKLARAKEPYLYEWIKEFLEQGNDEQMIVFSQYTWPLYEIQNKFGQDFAIITGQEKDVDRKNALESFQQGKIKCIALSYRCGSESLNLQNARYTLYHGFPWHDDALAQAMARTRRSGQTRKTFHYFLMSGQNDIKIYNLVRSKKKSNDAVKDALRIANPFIKQVEEQINFQSLF